jgi:hypothetical protein
MLEMVEEAALKLYGDAGSPSNSACNYDRPKPSHSYSSPQPILSFLSLGLPFFLSERPLLSLSLILPSRDGNTKQGSVGDLFVRAYYSKGATRCTLITAFPYPYYQRSHPAHPHYL